MARLKLKDIVYHNIHTESCHESLLSGTRYRVQDNFFSASSEDGGYPAHAARLDGDSWCSQDPPLLQQPFLQITFETAVNISVLRIGGFHETLLSTNHYVFKFRVLVDGGSNNSLSELNSSSNSMVS